MNILVSGGAGYIGSHAVKRLIEAGHRPVVVDNLFRGHRQAVPANVPLYETDTTDTAALQSILDRERIEGVMHFAALAYVDESTAQPLTYYHNNTAGTISLLRAMERVGVGKLVFSSSCTVYGEPKRVPLEESMERRPVSPYGWSKWCVEQILGDVAASDSRFAYAALRYFNVAGAAADGSLGEDHDPETHLVPSVLLAALGRRDGITVFGTDYPTPDGTCIRDYVHVEDLCAAHVKVMEALRPGDARIYNLGIGRGYSVKQVVDTARQITGRDFPVHYGSRRRGDPAMLFASAEKIRQDLQWQPKYTTLEPIVQSAWNWFRAHPHGYGA
jgi:UDP-glucose-4-epimerase GalE